jgi:hypothetical protein
MGPEIAGANAECGLRFESPRIHKFSRKVNEDYTRWWTEYIKKVVHYMSATK